MTKTPHFNNSYLTLPEQFYQKVMPTHVANPKLLKFNNELASELQLENLKQDELAEIFSGNRILEGSEPIAQVYAGHQFGHFVPQLGDGRAILLGELIDIHGHRRDLQLKGAGKTIYSRSGDGRAWLGPVIREYIVSEAMYHLGVPTTRALAAVSTGESIMREQELPGAMLTRVASSHIRIGTFEYFSARQDLDSLRLLANYVIERHYAPLKNQQNKYLELLRELALAQAKLIAKWYSLGFVHGVMNTDNSSIVAETIDYGPCAFIDFYNPASVFSSIDRHGRYAYNNQATIGLWNLSSFANAIFPLISENDPNAEANCHRIFDLYKSTFESEYRSIFLSKIGSTDNSDEAYILVTDLLALMSELKADFTLSFRYLADIIEEGSDTSSFLKLFDNYKSNETRIYSWINRWRSSLTKPKTEITRTMKDINPIYIPRNHLIEEAITKAHHDNDLSLFHSLADCLSKPFLEQRQYQDLMRCPANKGLKYTTYCGT